MIANGPCSRAIDTVELSWLGEVILLVTFKLDLKYLFECSIYSLCLLSLIFVVMEVMLFWQTLYDNNIPSQCVSFL